MFIWLPSYPKSGNTLVRAMLSSYFFSKNGIFEFNHLKNINQFPHVRLFERLGIDIENENEVLKNYINVQSSINKKNEIQFLKTHSYLFNIDNNPFTDIKNSLGAIYIVRDPRNVVTSYAHHYNISIEESLKRMTQSIHYGLNAKSDNDLDRIKVYMGSWSSHYNSWKSFKSAGRYLLIKYEDILKEKENSLLKILEFINKINGSNFPIDREKLKAVLDSTGFEKMRDMEKKEGFNESKTDQKTGKKVPFFNLGIQNNWKKNLKDEIRTKIEISFKNEMKELGYL